MNRFKKKNNAMVTGESASAPVSPGAQPVQRCGPGGDAGAGPDLGTSPACEAPDHSAPPGLHTKIPSTRMDITCHACERVATVYCQGCSTHLCRRHDAKRHLFPSKKHTRRRPSQADYFSMPASQRPGASPRTPNGNSASRRGGTVKQIQDGYESLVMAVIRPPRCKYKPADLGPEQMGVGGGLAMHRRNFEVVNRRGQRLQCSQWCPSFVDDAGVLPCVMYLHANSSARVDVVRTRSLLVLGRLGCSVVSFDFSGSGLSDGEYVSLGYYEQHDVADVIDHLRTKGWARKFTLWGRSMGAASALLFAAQYQPEGLCGLVLDSPFSSFKRLASDLVALGQISVPKVALQAALGLIRRSVKKRTRADINALSPAAGAPTISCPALFLLARRDTMVPPLHGEMIASVYKGPSYILQCDGGHNSARPSYVQECVGTFIKATFRWPQHSMQEAFGAITKRAAEADPLAVGGAPRAGAAAGSAGQVRRSTLPPGAAATNPATRAATPEDAMALVGDIPPLPPVGSTGRAKGKGAGPRSPGPRGMEPKWAKPVGHLSLHKSPSTARRAEGAGPQMFPLHTAQQAPAGLTRRRSRDAPPMLTRRSSSLEPKRSSRLFCVEGDDCGSLPGDPLGGARHPLGTASHTQPSPPASGNCSPVQLERLPSEDRLYSAWELPERGSRLADSTSVDGSSDDDYDSCPDGLSAEGEEDGEGRDRHKAVVPRGAPAQRCHTCKSLTCVCAANAAFPLSHKPFIDASSRKSR